MKKYFLKTWLLAVLVVILISSCEKQLKIDPRQSINASTALTSREALDAAITGVYARLKSARIYGRDMITHGDALADNGFATNKSGRLLPEAQNNQGAHYTTTIWTSGYAGINQINLVLEAIPKLDPSLAVSQAEINKWEGQLYFLRGLFYFNMMQVYAYFPTAVITAQNRGGVPILTRGISSADSALLLLPARAPIDDVYNLIVADFTLAESKLLTSGAGVGTALANKNAAQAMLARVNLFRGNYSQAKTWADACITSSGSRITTTANYVAQWRGEHNQETLFQVRFASAAENIGVNESLQTSHSTLVTPGNVTTTGGWGDLVPTLTMLTDLGITLAGGMTTTNFAVNAVVASRNTDIRNLMYEPGTTGRGPAKVECTKYMGKNGAINLDNAPVIRVSEAYLIRAEAASTTGSPVANLANALADLKFIKSRRYTNYTGSAEEISDNALDLQGVFNEVMRQRRIEFAFEGHRFFDLKRLGMDLIKSPHYNSVPFTNTRILAPIPQGDVDGNPNLQQNLGY